jgi:MYXO-CTERM domain-containing protein
MKKLTRLLGIFAFTAFIGVTTPVVVLSQDAGTSTTQSIDDRDDDDNGKWGLAGLLGLLGLLGLRRKDDHRTTTTHVNR